MGMETSGVNHTIYLKNLIIKGSRKWIKPSKEPH